MNTPAITSHWETLVSNLLRNLYLAGVMAAPLAAQAAPTLSDVLGASNIGLSGALDVSYDWDDVDGAPALHAFDVNQQGFSLHQLNVTASKTFSDGIGATANVVIGDDAALYSGGNQFDLTQGFISYTTGGLTVIGGRFVTLAGYEVINPAGNINASRSLLFFFQPLLHTGVRGTFKVSDMLAFTAGLNNGVQISKVDNNTEQTVEAQVAFTPSSAVAVYLTGYSGNEDTAPNGGAVIRSDTLDLVTTFTLSDAVSFALNADYFATEVPAGGTFEVKGAAAYANVKFGAFRIAPRLEYLDVDTGTASSGWIQEQTLTFGYAASSALELLAEVRSDQIDEGDLGSFGPHDVNAVSNNDQTTATIKAIYKF
jgi:hypothetical protein